MNLGLRGAGAARRRQHNRTFLLLLITAVFSAGPAQAQVITVTDHFNDGDDVGWVHYHPLQPPPFNEPASWTFPPDGAGGFAYRIFGGPPQDTSGGPARVGSFRNDATYADFFNAVDILGWDNSVYNSFGFTAARVNSPGFLTTSGYLVGFIDQPERRRAPQSALFFYRFQTELNVAALDPHSGGIAFVSPLSSARPYRLVFTGAGANLKGALYYREDLLEPIARIGGVDTTFASGSSGIGGVNTQTDKHTDWTFDNYFASGTPDDPLGFPGTPQVVELSPAPNALFYPASSGLNFRLRTFSTTQIDTNSIRLFLNGANVSAQLAITDNAGLLDPPGTDYSVQYTGTLLDNLIYRGRIVVNDPSGRGTTNNWVFDTFEAFDPSDPLDMSGRVLVEAEDYNHSSGLFQDHPPVSGRNSAGMPVGGPPFDGYYSAVGTPDVDYFSSRPAAPNSVNNQYRGGDRIGTSQDIRLVRDTRRPQHISADIPDYEVWQLRAGDWMNYTRTFLPHTYRIYLRASAQARRTVRFDEVTGDPALPNQTKSIRGLFLVPNTISSTRFRYVPLSDAVGNPQLVSAADVRTFRLTALDPTIFVIGGVETSDIQLNYLLFLPATNAPGNLPPWVAFASPGADADDVHPEAQISLAILDRDTAVDPASIRLWLDGVEVTSSATITATVPEGTGASLTFTPSSALRPNSVHTIRLVFADNGSPSLAQTNQWTFKVRNMLVLPASFARSNTDGLERGFVVQVHKARNDAPGSHFPNNASRAQRQLAGGIIDTNTGMPYVNEAAGPNGQGVYGETSGINYEQHGTPAGHFGGDIRYPGIGGSDPNHFAMAATAYLQLAPGAYRFGGFSDDGFVVSAGPNLPATNLVVGDLPGCCTPVEFDFFVETNGWYPFRFLHWEGGGGAFAEWYSVNARTGARTLINDFGVAAAIPAFRPTGLDLNIPAIPANFALPPGSGRNPGFNIQIHKARNDAPESDFPNSSDRAERQLADQIIDALTGQPYVNQAVGGPDFADTINFEQAGLAQGYFTGDTPFPGVDPTFDNADPNYLAMAATTFVELPRGHYRFGVRSDDGFKLTTGPSPQDTNTVLGIFEGGRGSSPTDFEFRAPADGLYPMRLLYYEGTGGADLELYSLDLATGERRLLNSGAPGALRAFREVALYELLNPRVEGNTFSVDFATIVGKTFTLQYQTTLGDGAWHTVRSVSGDGTTMTVTHTFTTPATFYRLKVE